MEQYSQEQQTYWSLLKIFLNHKKLSLIPLLFHGNRFITDFKEKAELFNSSFSNQWFLLRNCSKLLTNPRYVVDKRLRKINFTTDNIEKIISFQTKPMLVTTSVYLYLKHLVIPFVNL